MIINIAQLNNLLEINEEIIIYHNNKMQIFNYKLNKYRSNNIEFTIKSSDLKKIIKQMEDELIEYFAKGDNLQIKNN